MRSESVTRLQSFSEEYAESCSLYLLQRIERVDKIISDYVTIYPLALWWGSSTKRMKSFSQALCSLAPFDIHEFTEDLLSYYNKRRDALRLMYQEAGISGEVPNIPIYIASYGMNMPISLFHDSLCLGGKYYEMVKYSVCSFWPSRKAAADAIKTRFFPEIEAVCELPVIFAKTLIEQTALLWGASAEHVYKSRCELLVNRVLPVALEWLKKWLPSNYEQTFEVQECKEYRKLTHDVCADLDDLASRVADCPPLEVYKGRFSDEEFESRVGEAIQRKENLPSAICEVLEQEFAYIRLRYNVVISQ